MGAGAGEDEGRIPTERVFPCPICGSPTRVAETRSNASGIRRRRRCVGRSCPGGITTQEIRLEPGFSGGRWSGAHVLVPGGLWARLIRIARAMLDQASEVRRLDSPPGPAEPGDPDPPSPVDASDRQVGGQS